MLHSRRVDLVKEISQTCNWSATIRDSLSGLITLDRSLVTAEKQVYFVVATKERRRR